MVADGATGSGAKQAVMTRNMASNPPNGGAGHTTGCVHLARERRRRDECSGSNKERLHTELQDDCGCNNVPLRSAFSHSAAVFKKCWPYCIRNASLFSFPVAVCGNSATVNTASGSHHFGTWPS